MTKSKWAAIAIIGAGGAQVGAMGGWNLAPLTLELGRDNLGAIGATVGVLLALAGCCCASEYAEARAENQRQLTVLRRLASVPSNLQYRNSRSSHVNSDWKIRS